MEIVNLQIHIELTHSSKNKQLSTSNYLLSSGISKIIVFNCLKVTNFRESIAHVSNDLSHNTANASTSSPPSSFLTPHPRPPASLFTLLSCFPSRREHWKLLSSLKTTVEGLVSTNNPNVWSRYGGLQRLHKDMNNILSHGLKNEQVRTQEI